MLVVIALIAIVAALLFPVFTTMRESGRRSTCLGNLRQMGHAYQLYANDYDEVMPLVTTMYWVTTPAESRPPSPPSPVRTSYWSNALQPYVRHWNIYHCPSTLRADWLRGNNDPMYAFSYTYNGLLSGYPLSGIVSPSKCILQMEGLGTSAVNGFTLANPQIEAGPEPYDPDLTECAFYGGVNLGVEVVTWNMQVHARGSNLLYVDGHTAWIAHPSHPDKGGIFADIQPSTGFSYWWDGRCPWNFRPTTE